MGAATIVLTNLLKSFRINSDGLKKLAPLTLRLGFALSKRRFEAISKEFLNWGSAPDPERLYKQPAAAEWREAESETLVKLILKPSEFITHNNATGWRSGTLHLPGFGAGQNARFGAGQKYK